jgi:hypothetical protein
MRVALFLDRSIQKVIDILTIHGQHQYGLVDSKGTPIQVKNRREETSNRQ